MPIFTELLIIIYNLASPDKVPALRQGFLHKKTTLNMWFLKVLYNYYKSNLIP